MGALSILQGSPNQYLSYKIGIESQKRISRKRFEKHDCLMDFDAKFGGLRSKNKYFALYLLQFFRGLAGSGNLMKIATQKVIEYRSKSEPRAPRGLIFLIWGRCRFSTLHFVRFPYPCGPTGIHREPTQDPPGIHWGPTWDPPGISGSSGRQVRGRTRVTSGSIIYDLIMYSKIVRQV